MLNNAGYIFHLSLEKVFISCYLDWDFATTILILAGITQETVTKIVNVLLGLLISVIDLLQTHQFMKRSVLL